MASLNSISVIVKIIAGFLTSKALALFVGSEGMALVGNLRNFTPASNGEVIWGESISGVKGFYSLATFSTDTTTEPGGNKQLFSVESSYIINNGY